MTDPNTRRFAFLTPPHPSALGCVRLWAEPSGIPVSRGSLPEDHDSRPRLVQLAGADTGLLGKSPDGSYWFTSHGGAGVAASIRSALVSRGFTELEQSGQDPDFLAGLAGAASLYQRTVLEMLPTAPSAAAVRMLLAAMAVEVADPESVNAAAMLSTWPSVAPWLTKPLVVLAGPANAGKSTLFNRLVDQGAAIVSSDPGTTRDVLTGDWTLPNGAVVTLADTPGIRPDSEVTSPGERDGAVIAKKWIERAACRIVLEAANSENEPHLDGVHVATKCDIHDPPGWADIAISAKTGDGLELLTNSIMGLLFREPSHPLIPLDHVMALEVQNNDGRRKWFGR